MKNFKWHKIPHWLHWFCIVLAAPAWAFDCCHAQVVCLDPFLVSREYDLYFFRLLETSGGNWYFRLG